MPNAAETAYERLRTKILTGEFASGSRLREEELSSLFGISRTPIREALQRLSVEGLVETIPNRGAHVAAWSPNDLRDIFELRAVLETYSAGRAATDITDEHLDELSALADEMERLAEEGGRECIDEIADLNSSFHQRLIDSTGNDRLNSFLSVLIQVPLVHHTFRRYSDEALRRSFHHHRELLAACRARDSEWAAAVMRAHIMSARRALDERDET